MESATNGAVQPKADEEQARRARRAALKDLNVNQAGKGALIRDTFQYSAMLNA